MKSLCVSRCKQNGGGLIVVLYGNYLEAIVIKFIFFILGCVISWASNDVH